MKKVILLFLLMTSIANSQNKDFTQYVNPFIGTGGHGHTYPGASMPFGMVQLSPDTRLEGWDGCGGYHYSDSVIYGFSHTHLSGTGVPDYGDILVMPTVGEIHFLNTEYSSSFSHKNESASPGYYSVLLDKYNVKAELTATIRAGFHKYTFPKSDNSNFIIDLKHRDEVVESYIEFSGNDEIRGLRRSKSWADDQYVYFVMKFSKPFKKHGIASNDTLITEQLRADGKNIKGFVSFETTEGEVIYVKCGISGVSVEGAEKNLNAEITGWDFDGIRNNARDEWNKELNKIQVEGGTETQTRIFYTALYHALLNPNVYMDVDGQFRGTDHKVHTANGFTNHTVFSLWDTFRAEHPLFTIIEQNKTNDFINTFLAEYEYGGMLPVWELSGCETFCMIGYHSIPVIADAYVKGIRGYDINKVYDAMKNTAMNNTFGLDSYKQFGFVAQDMEHESVSKTLEYAYDDWCISRVAKEQKKEEDYKNFSIRGQNYKNLFDPATGFMRAKVNGAWYTPFDPYEVNSNYTEANAWQYAMYVPQDICGLAALHGGKQNLAKKLDDLFSASGNMTGLDLSDITGMIGQYAHGNEPSHQIAYMYDYLLQPWKTQELIHKICSEFYKDDPDGLIGNEDCGQMSAWYVMSAIGFYSVCPGQKYYATGTPLFPKVTINTESGKKFVIKANGVAPENYYIKSATINGNKMICSFINHDDIMKGGEINFEMSSASNKNWGIEDYADKETLITDYTQMPVPYINAKGKVFRDKTELELKSFYGAHIYYTLDGSEPTLKSKEYRKPIVIDKTTTVKFFANEISYGSTKVMSGTFYKIPEGLNITIKSEYAKRYSAGGPDGLIDGIRGKVNWRLGDWQGYKGQDFEAVLDLGKVKDIHKVSAGFLQDIRSWIWFPTEVKFYFSEDGVNYNDYTTVKCTSPQNIYDSPVEISDFKSNINMHNVRYIKVVAANFGKIPSWHPGAGSDTWIFIDEIKAE